MIFSISENSNSYFNDDLEKIREIKNFYAKEVNAIIQPDYQALINKRINKKFNLLILHEFHQYRITN